MSEQDDTVDRALLEERGGATDESVEPWLEALARPLPASTAAPGMMVTERVRLEEPLGSGGMGVVWKARHLTLEQDVAVKFVRAATDEVAVKRFEREAKLAAKIDSPHAVRVFDHGVTDDDTPFIVMEQLKGTTLSERLEADGVLSPALTTAIVAQTAQVLDEAHEMGMAHRDIKPGNLFLLDGAYDVFVKVLDFGIARHADAGETQITGSGALVGTPQFMAPEQLLDGEPGDAAADLWALAVVAYACLTGRCPFEGKTTGALGAALEKGSFSPPSELTEGLPPGVDAWFARALSRDPAARHGSAGELASTLSDALEGAKVSRVAVEPHSTPRGGVDPVATTIAEASARPQAAPRRRWLLAGVGLAGVAGLMYWLTGSPETTTRSPNAPATVNVAEPADDPPMPAPTASSSIPSSAMTSAPEPTPTAPVVARPAPVKPKPAASAPRTEDTAAPAQPTSTSAPPPSAPEPKPKGGLIKDLPF